MADSANPALIVVGAAIALAACARPATLAPSATPAATIKAISSPAVAASNTPAPPPPPALATPTLFVVSGPELDCKLNSQVPVNGTKLEPRTDFTVRWNVTNTGTAVWDPGAVELIYAAGTRMYYDPVVPLTETVAPGESVTLIVDMKALRNTSSYVTTWTLRRGDEYFCTLSSMIYVQWFEGKERNW